MKKSWNTHVCALGLCGRVPSRGRAVITDRRPGSRKVGPSQRERSPSSTGRSRKLGMDAGMTMVYKAQDPAMLKAVKAGPDKVKFDADEVKRPNHP